MDRATYRLQRRMIIVTKLAEMFDGIYALRLQAAQEADLEAMLEEPIVEIVLEDEEVEDNGEES